MRTAELGTAAAVAETGCRAAPRGSVQRSVTRRLSSTLVLLAVSILAGCGERPRAAEEPPVAEGTDVGDRAPGIHGESADGREFEYRPDGRTSTLLVFYRGYHCGLCRERLRELQEHLSEYEAVRANVIALSTDSLSLVRHAADELGLTFPLVAVDSAALRPWEVFDNGTALPLPASYLLDGNGVVVFRHVGRNAADRASDLELLAALHQLRRGGR